MSQGSPALTNHAPKLKGKKKAAPPEERFWQRYSPHHEFPLSTAASIFLHVLGVGLLVLGAILVSRLGLEQKPPEVASVMIEGGGGGREEGVGDNSGKGIIPSGIEQKDVVRQPINLPQPPKAEQLTNVQPRPADIDLKPSENARVIDDSALGEQLSNIGQQAKTQIDGIIAGKGKGGEGSGGGKGKGRGTGDGDKVGPGTGSGKISQREKRQLRWVMMFDTRDGSDYLRQLSGLGAILALPQGEGSYYVIRDLLKRPAVGMTEDLGKLDRIYWIDDKPQSVASLANALGIPPPPLIAAFFPQSLEKELLDKELAYFQRRKPNGQEDEILETRFRVLPRGGGKYEAVVHEQRAR